MNGMSLRSGDVLGEQWAIRRLVDLRAIGIRGDRLAVTLSRALMAAPWCTTVTPARESRRPDSGTELDVLPAFHSLLAAANRTRRD